MAKLLRFNAIMELRSGFTGKKMLGIFPYDHKRLTIR